MRELNLKKCNNCGALVKVINDCHCACGINCCDEKMSDVKPNSIDASAEKHVPTYEIDRENIVVRVDHVMDDDHFIEWVMFVTDNSEETIYFRPGIVAKATFAYQKGILYAYCNKHGLWSKEVN